MNILQYITKKPWFLISSTIISLLSLILKLWDIYIKMPHVVIFTNNYILAGFVTITISIMIYKFHKYDHCYIFKPTKLSKYIHNFEHTHIESIEKIQSILQKDEVDNDLLYEVVYSSVKECLKKIGTIIEDYTSYPVSLNIKLLINREGSEGITEIKNTELYTYCRSESQYEEKNTIAKRRNNEIFTLFDDYPLDLKKEDSIKEWIEKTKKEFTLIEKNNPNYRFNSAYNFVFGKEHYYIDNNCKKSIKNGLLFNNSERFSEYYSSFCVFLIGKKMHALENVENTEKSYGVLIIDSPFQNVFRNEPIKQLCGYFTHRLHQIFQELEKFESKNYKTPKNSNEKKHHMNIILNKLKNKSKTKAFNN